MRFTKIRLFASMLIITMLAVTACTGNDESEAVANRFVRAYFGQDNLSEAVKLTSGSAKEKLEKALQEIEAVGAKEPAKDKPVVDVTLQEAQPISKNEMLYVFRVVSTVTVGGMEPITARLWLSKEGNSWYVTKFIQDE